MKRNAQLLILTLGFANAACAPFNYTSQIQDEIVVPILKMQLGEAYVYYDLERPAIRRSRDEAEPEFNWDFQKGMSPPHDPPYVVIVLNARTLQVCSVSSNLSYIPPPRQGPSCRR